MTHTRPAAPWMPVDVDWWPAIAAALPLPWPRDAILLDLRWWADRERMRRGARPGRPALAARWGVTSHAARVLMADADAWACPIHGDPMHTPGHRQPVASESPAGRQRIASDDYSEPAQSADFRQPVASRSPAVRQPLASESPHARVNIKTEHTTQNPEDKEQTRAGRALASEESSKSASEVQPDRKRKPRQLDPSTLAVWAHYRTRCPQRTQEAPPAYLAGPMAQAVKQHGPDDVRLLIDWLADGDGRAEYLRREGYAWSDTPWRASKLPPYLDLARAWDARGRVAEVKPAQRGPVSKFDAQLKAWNDAQNGSIIDLQPEPMPPESSSSFEAMTQAFARYMPKAPPPAPAPTTPEPEDDIPF